MCMYISGELAQRQIHTAAHPVAGANIKGQQALVGLSNRKIVDASRGRTCHCKMSNNR